MKSFSGKIWNFPNVNIEELDHLKSTLKVGDLVAMILLNRGYTDSASASGILHSKLRDTIPDPSLILDMDAAVDRTYGAIKKRQNITVIGDYDVDGVTSTALMVKYLRRIGMNPKSYIPNRFVDGYGLSDGVLDVVVEAQSDLVIVVDSGINAVNEVSAGNDLGIDFVILDHHLQLSPELPQAVAVVDPNRLDQEEIGTSYIKNLCAAGVVFLFLIALQRKLRSVRFFNESEEPNLLEFSDLVTLGTLCDVMLLRGINRAITKYTVARNKYSQGIISLMEEFKFNEVSSLEDLLFFVGPAINAAGRVDDPQIALNLLLEESPEKSRKIASNLIELNQKRKVIEHQLFSDAMVMINEQKLFNNKGICVYSENWNIGVSGIVAGKLRDIFQKPIFVISILPNGICRGSSRSVEGVHLGSFLEKASRAGIILTGGGHALAGGFSISRDKIPDFQKFVESEIKGEFINTLSIDYSLTTMSDLEQIFNEISILEPFGNGIAKPVFCFKRLRLSTVKRTASGSHVMASFTGEFGRGNLRTIIFNVASKSDFLDQLERSKDELLDVAGYINHNKPYKPNIVIEDIRKSC